MRTLISVVLTLILIASCRDDNGSNSTPLPDEQPVSYFLEKDSFVYFYRFDSIKHDPFREQSDTSRGSLKKYFHKLVSVEDNDIWQIKIFWRYSDEADWTPLRQEQVEITTDYFLKTVNGVKFANLRLPPAAGNQWDGNKFNNKQEQLYTYTAVDANYSTPAADYTSTVEVTMKSDSTFLFYMYESAVYAPETGLVYYQNRDEEFQEDYPRGFQYQMWLD